MIQVSAFSPEVAQAIQSGDKQAFLVGLASTVSLWMQLGGVDILFLDRCSVSFASFVVGVAPEQRALLAAGCDLYNLMMLAPESREALLHFLDQPVLEHAKGE